MLSTLHVAVVYFGSRLRVPDLFLPVPAFVTPLLACTGLICVLESMLRLLMTVVEDSYIALLPRTHLVRVTGLASAVLSLLVMLLFGYWMEFHYVSGFLLSVSDVCQELLITAPAIFRPFQGVSSQNIARAAPPYKGRT